MEINEFVELTAETDHFTDQDKAITIGLFGIAGEAGSIVSEAKKWFRGKSLPEGLKANISEELGDLMWYIGHLARRLDIDLEEVIGQNSRKNKELWSSEGLSHIPYDNHGHDNEKFLRQMEVGFEEVITDDLVKVRMVPKGELSERINRERERKGMSAQLGDDLDDNSTVDDGYRYHDIIHLAHATVLGWSPVLRALMGAQRKSVGDKDRVEDGARAKAIEEGLAAFVFNYLESHGFEADYIDWNLFKHIRRTVSGLEVSIQPVAAWRNAYEQAFSVFLQLRDNGGGTVMCDLDKRQLVFLNEL